MQAVILAAGKSTRVGGNTPKPFMLWHHKPVLKHVVDSLTDMCDSPPIIATSYEWCREAQLIAPHARVIDAPSTGTATALAAAHRWLDATEFLVLPADTIYHKFDIKAMAHTHHLGLAYQLGARSGDSTIVFKNHYAAGISEKPERPASLFKSLMLYMLPIEIFSFLPEEKSVRGEYEIQDAINSYIFSSNVIPALIQVGNYKHFTSLDDF